LSVPPTPPHVYVKLEWYADTVVTGWNKARIGIVNDEYSPYTIELGYETGPGDHVSIAFERGQIILYPGEIESIADVMAKEQAMIDPVYFYFPAPGTYRLVFYARLKGTDVRFPVKAYDIEVSGEAPAPPRRLDVLYVTIPEARSEDNTIRLVVEIVFTETAPAGTTVYVKYYVNNNVVGSEEIVVEQPARSIRFERVVERQEERAWLTVCASLAPEAKPAVWVCGPPVYIGPLPVWLFIVLLLAGIAVGLAAGKKSRK